MYVYDVDEVGMPKSECVWNRGGDVCSSGRSIMDDMAHMTTISDARR